MKTIFEIESINPLNSMEVFNILTDALGDTDIKGVTELNTEDLKELIENEDE